MRAAPLRNVQFWLRSRIETQDAIEIGGRKMPDDETFIGYAVQSIAR